jgi:hypothetical protein
VSCGGAIIIIMIDRTIAITPSAMSLGGIASSKRSVDNFAQFNASRDPCVPGVRLPVGEFDFLLFAGRACTHKPIAKY